MRKYTDDPRELGQEDTPAAYVAALAAVFAACWRVLRDDGTLWLNLGDKYGSKNLLGLPWRAAFALQDAGWVLRSEVIWHKPSAMPESVNDRPTRAHETLFLFAKQGRYFYDAAAIAEAAQEHHAAAASFKRRGNKRSTVVVPGSTATHRADRPDVLYSGGARNARTVWSIASSGIPDAHYAPMPEALARRCILAGSRPGDAVLDPFAGSGTTLRAAVSLARHAIGIDLGYAELQARRLDGVQIAMTALETPL